MNDLILELKDRVLLANQYRILEKLYPDEAKDFAAIREALESGYTLDYAEITGHFSDEIPPEECREVRAILDMYRMMDSAYENMEDNTGINEKDVRFPGFDGNKEGRQYGCARYLIEEQGRWEEANSGDLNTHRPMLKTYRAMLQQWETSKDTFSLTKEDVLRIIAAAR